MNATHTPMYDQNPAVAELNHVDGFDPKRYMRTTSTEDGQGLYLDVKYRKLWLASSASLLKVLSPFYLV